MSFAKDAASAVRNRTHSQCGFQSLRSLFAADNDFFRTLLKPHLPDRSAGRVVFARKKRENLRKARPLESRNLRHFPSRLPPPWTR